MNNPTRSLAAGALVSLLTVGTFALGTHLGPKQPQGHNLYRAAAVQPQPPAGALRLASAMTPPRRIADDPSSGAADDGSAADAFSADGPASTFQQVYVLLKRNFVDPLPGDSKLGHGAAAAMLASLQDPQSRFLEPSEMTELQGETTGHYHGLGAITSVRKVVHPKDKDVPEYTEYRLTVVAPLPGSPAEKSGLMPGDVITDVNNQWIATYDPAMDQYKALKAAQNDPVIFNKLVAAIQKKIDTSIALTAAEAKLSDPAAKSLTLRVVRANAPAPLMLTVDTSAETVVTPITSRTLPGGLGYIRISQLTQGSEQAFDTALTNLGTPKGLILDLRDSPGGMIDAASAIAGRLSGAKTLGIVQAKGKKETLIPITAAKSVACPVVVLVNKGTASSAELLASALQANGCKLVGEKTFGDAGDVKAIALRDGSGFTMTVGKLLTSARGDFSEVGLTPDVAAPESAAGDEALNRAVGLLAGQVARLPSARG